MCHRCWMSSPDRMTPSWTRTFSMERNEKNNNFTFVFLTVTYIRPVKWGICIWLTKILDICNSHMLLASVTSLCSRPLTLRLMTSSRTSSLVYMDVLSVSLYMFPQTLHYFISYNLTLKANIVILYEQNLF